MDVWMNMIRDNHLIIDLDSMPKDLNPYLVDAHFIISIYDPMTLCNFPKEDMNIFDYILLAKK